MAERARNQGEQSKKLVELVNELRVAVTGVNVLLGFLLLVPFTSEFAESTGRDRVAYAIGFWSAAAAALLMIGPSVYRWMRWGERESGAVVRMMRVFALTGSALLAMAIVAVVFLVTDVILGDVAWLVAPVAALVAVVVWYGLPWWRGLHR